MKIKTLLALLLCGVFALSSAANADVTVTQAHSKKGTAIYLNVDGSSATASCTGKECTITPTNGDPTGNLTFQTTLFANGRVAGASASSISSSSTFMSAASIAYAIILKAVGGNGVDNSPGSILPDGVPGQELVILVNKLVSGGSWLLTPTHKTGFNTLSFTAVGSQAELLFVDSTIGWVLKSHSNVTVA